MIRIYHRTGKRISHIAVTPALKPRLYARPRHTYEIYGLSNGEMGTRSDPACIVASYDYHAQRFVGNSLPLWHVATPKDAEEIEQIEDAITVLRTKLQLLLQRRFEHWPALTLEQAEEHFESRSDYAEKKSIVLAQIVEDQYKAEQ